MTEGYINTTPVNRWTHPLFGTAKPSAIVTTPTPIHDALVHEMREILARQPQAKPWRPADLVLGYPDPNDVPTQALSGVIVNRT
jgi:hypothetical protein